MVEGLEPEQVPSLMWIRALEVFFTLLFLLVVLTQLLIPGWKELPLFPLFRRRRKAEAAIAKAHEALDLGRLIRELDELKAQLGGQSGQGPVPPITQFPPPVQPSAQPISPSRTRPGARKQTATKKKP